MATQPMRGSHRSSGKVNASKRSNSVSDKRSHSSSSGSTISTSSSSTSSDPARDHRRSRSAPRPAQRTRRSSSRQKNRSSEEVEKGREATKAKKAKSVNVKRPNSVPLGHDDTFREPSPLSDLGSSDYDVEQPSADRLGTMHNKKASKERPRFHHRFRKRQAWPTNVATRKREKRRSRSEPPPPRTPKRWRWKELELAKLGIPSPEPLPDDDKAEFQPIQKLGNLWFLSGHLPVDKKGAIIKGKIGNKNIKKGYEAARRVALCVIDSLRDELDGDLDRVDQVLVVFGIVWSAVDFHKQSKVLDGCSDVFLQYFGTKRGMHERAVTGVTELPLDIPVEIEVVVRIKNDR